MTHSYTVEGITCSGCISKVKSKLLTHPGITGAEITLEDKKAVISMQHHLSVDELQKTIGEDTKYRIHATADAVHDTADSLKSGLSQYKPLLIITLFITGVAVLTAHGDIPAGMNHFMAGFFLVFSFFKLLDVRAFASSYAMYDLIAGRIKAWGYIYPFAELALGIAFLTGVDPFLTNVITVVLMGVSSVGVIQSVIRKQKIQCACLGAVFNLPMSTVTIVEDLVMVAMAGYMLVS